MSVLGVFALVLPVMLVVTACAALMHQGPLGVAGAVVFVAVVVYLTRFTVRWVRAWWRASAR